MDDNTTAADTADFFPYRGGDETGRKERSDSLIRSFVMQKGNSSCESIQIPDLFAEEEKKEKRPSFGPSDVSTVTSTDKTIQDLVKRMEALETTVTKQGEQITIVQRENTAAFEKIWTKIDERDERFDLMDMKQDEILENLKFLASGGGNANGKRRNGRGTSNLPPLDTHIKTDGERRKSPVRGMQVRGNGIRPAESGDEFSISKEKLGYDLDDSWVQEQKVVES